MAVREDVGNIRLGLLGSKFEKSVFLWVAEKGKSGEDFVDSIERGSLA